MFVRLARSGNVHDFPPIGQKPIGNERPVAAPRHRFGAHDDGTRPHGICRQFRDRPLGDLVATLNKLNVPEREKNELLGVLGPMKRDIVEKPMASMR